MLSLKNSSYEFTPLIIVYESKHGDPKNPLRYIHEIAEKSNIVHFLPIIFAIFWSPYASAKPYCANPVSGALPT
jgi:hypothetical protein